MKPETRGLTVIDSQSMDSAQITDLPTPLHGKTSQQDGFAGSSRRRADSLTTFGYLPEIGEDGNAAGVNCLSGGILVEINKVSESKHNLISYVH
jgi:hypothetical protein